MHSFHPNFFIIHLSRMTCHSHAEVTEKSALVFQTQSLLKSHIIDNMSGA